MPRLLPLRRVFQLRGAAEMRQRPRETRCGVLRWRAPPDRRLPHGKSTMPENE
jgi:hypothetical protein